MRPLAVASGEPRLRLEATRAFGRVGDMWQYGQLRARKSPNTAGRLASMEDFCRGDDPASKRSDKNDASQPVRGSSLSGVDAPQTRAISASARAMSYPSLEPFRCCNVSSTTSQRKRRALRTVKSVGAKFDPPPVGGSACFATAPSRDQSARRDRSARRGALGRAARSASAARRDPRWCLERWVAWRAPRRIASSGRGHAALWHEGLPPALRRTICLDAVG
jgi:hypothetical protein